MRSSEPLPGIKKHGYPGYEEGCGCLVCRRGNREKVAKYRARKEQKMAAKVVVPDAAGKFEADVIRYIDGLGLDSDEAKLISDMMLFNARFLDQIPSTERWHLANATQKTLLELKGQLQKLKGEAPGALPDPANSLQGFLNGLTTQG